MIVDDRKGFARLGNEMRIWGLEGSLWSLIGWAWWAYRLPPWWALKVNVVTRCRQGLESNHRLKLEEPLCSFFDYFKVHQNLRLSGEASTHHFSMWNSRRVKVSSSRRCKNFSHANNFPTVHCRLPNKSSSHRSKTKTFFFHETLAN